MSKLTKERTGMSHVIAPATHAVPASKRRVSLRFEIAGVHETVMIRTCDISHRRTVGPVAQRERVASVALQNCERTGPALPFREKVDVLTRELSS